VDLNDLRVSRPREIREAIGANFPRSAQKARVIPRLLDQVFKQHNSMVWDFVEQMGKVEARGYFERLEDVRPFVAALLARDFAGAHAFPVDADVARVLGRLAVVDPARESEVEMQLFLERAVKANRAYETQWLVKRLGEDLCIVDMPQCGKCPLNPMCPSALCPPGGKPKKKAVEEKPPAAKADKKGGARSSRPAKKTKAAGAAARKKARPVRRTKGR
jgi:endonuclease III